MDALMQRLNHLALMIDQWLRPPVLLAVRLFIAWVFFKSGLLKLSDWNSALFLFQYEYSVPLLPYTLAAYLATFAELTFPVLLVLGLGSRLAALGLLGMTLVIELFVYPNTTEHYYWMSILGMLAVVGPGVLSLDQGLKRFFRPRPQVSY